MSTLTFAPEENLNTLKDFAKQFNVTEVFVENKIKYDAPVVVQWINGCGLPVNIFSLNAS